ncbi:hypothetical protein N7522_001849 [Penicillium canescens]|nr:hypothetical protein N7522_001849 [Penicillium canescens]KAJ6066391.1 hypothetical protein N7444_000144 [Penicillium canescens]
MELLPTEILFGIVKYLDNWEVKQLSLSSRRVSDVCLPTLFRKLSVEFSNEGLDLLESVLESNLHRYIVSLEYVTPMLLKPAYVETCESYDDVNSREDWDEMEYLSGDLPSYTRVYKTLRRTCAEQQEIIETRRGLTLMSLAFNLLSNLKELILVFRQRRDDEDWETDYQQVYDMTQQRPYEHHIKLVLAALKGCSITLKAIELTCLDPPDDPPSGSWDSLTIPLTELVGHAPGLRLVESALPLTLLCRVKQWGPERTGNSSGPL